MLIKVTADRGQRWRTRFCPIALALKEAGFRNVRACSGYAVVGESEILLPPEAKAFMLNFDSYRTVLPFEFEFDARLPFFDRLKAALDEITVSLIGY